MKLLVILFSTLFLSLHSFGQAPVADFSARRLCVDKAIQIHDGSDNNPTSWSWTFEGGNPANSNLQSPTVTFPNTGMFDVTLTANNASGSDTQTKSIQVVLCEPSKGIYRIPYADNTDVDITRNHLDHLPDNAEIDMRGIGGTSYTIVAAASGIIRAMDDSNAEPTSCNNFLWIEHPNGEWSKYSHMQTGSSTALGLNVGDAVTVSQQLGIESDVGLASGDHLHFEIVVPNNPDTPGISTCGFLEDAIYYIPVICGIPSNYFLDETVYEAGPCDVSDCSLGIVVAGGEVDGGETNFKLSRQSTTTLLNANVRYRNGSTGLYRSEQTVIMRPGFQAERGSHFRAEIGPCR